MAVVVARLPLRLGDARTRVGVALALAVRLALQEPLVDLPLQLVRLGGVDGPQAVPDLHEGLRRVPTPHALSATLQRPRDNALSRPGVVASAVLCEVVDVLSNNGTTPNHAAAPVHNVGLFHLVVPSKQVDDRHRERVACVDRGNHLVAKDDEEGDQPTSSGQCPFLYHSAPRREWPAFL